MHLNPCYRCQQFRDQVESTQSASERRIIHGHPSEDPYSHVSKFLRVCKTYKQNGVPEDTIQMMLFEYSLAGSARDWLERLEPESITSFDQLSEKFIHQYFPRAKTARFLNEIRSFRQFEGESIHEA